MTTLTDLSQRLHQAPAVVVRVTATEGSVPREAGAWMAVFADDTLGTIGGGHLEFQAQQMARAVLAGQCAEGEHRFVLGPSLGQCCGGAVTLDLKRATGDDSDALLHQLAVEAAPVAVFGGGHVGRAIVRLLAQLPFAVTWIDSRDEIFPDDVSPEVKLEHSQPVHGAVAALDPGSRVLIMSFSHAEDLDVVAACLQRQRERGDLPFVGLIGSKTKWAVFRHRLEARGYTADELAHITCPIGIPGIQGKEPEVIAVAVAAQLLLPPRPPLRALGRPSGAQT